MLTGRRCRLNFVIAAAVFDALFRHCSCALTACVFIAAGLDAFAIECPCSHVAPVFTCNGLRVDFALFFVGAALLDALSSEGACALTASLGFVSSFDAPAVKGASCGVTSVFASDWLRLHFFFLISTARFDTLGRNVTCSLGACSSVST